MQQKNLLYISCLIFLTLLVSCKKDDLDDYDRGEPKDIIKGKIIDNITGQPILTEQPEGIRMRLFEEGLGANLTSIDFWAMSDGTYHQGRVFPGTYKVIPTDGAFFPVDTQTVTVNGLAEVNFTVTPFLAIDATITTESKSVKAVYKLKRTKVGAKISDAKILVSGVPTVSNRVFDAGKSVTRTLTGVDDVTILATQYTDVLGGLESGKIYYVRVAARTSGAQYNYSPVVKLVIP
jgi:hypothetical protein